MSISLRSALVFLVLALPLLPLAARAQPAKSSQMILETEPGAEGLSFCDSAHNLKTCASVHIETQIAIGIGVVLRLDGANFVVDWMGPGYYLENGLILEPTGPLVSDLRGQRWIEVYPDEGKVHTSRGWGDKDRNRALSAADTLALDAGPELKVKDVRLHVRVSPAPETAEKN
jgi:hypothetical protein